MIRFLPLFMILYLPAPAQDYKAYRLQYDNFEAGDPRAFRYLRAYIHDAKKAEDFPELFQAYKDAIHFTSDHKLAYADSMIWAATKTSHPDLLASAYISKGVVYYFNYRRFQPALDEFLKAWPYAERSANSYIYFKNLYHIGVVKSYLGYYSEALEIFLKCTAFFEKPQALPEPPNMQHNRRKALLNTLHQTAFCAVHLSRWELVENLVNRGLQEAGPASDFYLERSYFYKLQGQLAAHRRNDKLAVSLFNTALPGIVKKNDFTAASLVWFYRGKSEASLKNFAAAHSDFDKVDSIFRRYQFVLPEVRPAYEWLISYYQQNKLPEKQLYYTTQLLRADSIFAKDFIHLYPKIHGNYDTRGLLSSKKNLEQNIRHLHNIIYATLFFLFLAPLYFIFKRKSKQTLNTKSTRLIRSPAPADAAAAPVAVTPTPVKVPDKITAEILEKLRRWEEKRKYLQKGITLHKLAAQLGTNSTYLSTIIREERGCNFSTYLRRLRIQYITHMLLTEKKWRHYTLHTLATEACFSDRTAFTQAFVEFNKVKPLDFISQLQAPERN